VEQCIDAALTEAAEYQRGIDLSSSFYDEVLASVLIETNLRDSIHHSNKSKCNTKYMGSN